MPRQSYDRSVFINCPFDKGYKPLFRAAVFAVLRCGLHARSALEVDDSSQARLDKIFLMIEECRYGIHDLSRIESEAGFPRFNMPLELGIFLAAKRYGTGRQDRKSCLIFERDKHSYNRFISDVKGQDIAAHGGKPLELVRRVRDWLASSMRKSSRRKKLPGGEALWTEYGQFKRWLSPKCEAERLKESQLTWDDYLELVYEWIDDNPS